MNGIDNIQISNYAMNMQYTSQSINIDASKATTPLKNEQSLENKGNDINNAAVNVSISMQSMLVYVNVRSLEFAQQNTEAQDMLNNIFNNKEVFHFLDGREAENGFDLKELGYDGKPITQLTVDEAKELVSEDGFFGVKKTSERVSNFAFNLSGDSVKLLEEAKKGIIKGFEEAEKMWGGKLPDISYETQEKTLELIDKRIAEMLGKDSKKDNLGETPAETLDKKDKETQEEESVES